MSNDQNSQLDSDRSKGARSGKPELNPTPIGDPEPSMANAGTRSDPSPGAWQISASKKVDDLSRHESGHDAKHEPKHGTHPDAKHEPHQKVVEGTKPAADQKQAGRRTPSEVRK